jgi:nucleotide-binding universal stress UspA family protein
VAAAAGGTHARGLAAIADEQKTDLIVAGARGHSRLRE